VAYLTDLGAVKVLEGSELSGKTKLTQTGFAVGTPAYMAPEVLFGKAYDGRADQYALAAMVYEALSGRTPYPAASLPELIQALSYGKAERLDHLCGVPEAVADAVARAVSRRVENRYATCGEFVKAVCAGFATTPKVSVTRIFVEEVEELQLTVAAFPDEAQQPSSALRHDFDFGTLRDVVEPHRGGLILTLGIVSILTVPLCFIVSAYFLISAPLGPFVMAIASADLEKMRQGKMDKSGWGVTQAGYILGIVSTVLLIVGVAFTCLWVIFLAAVGVGAHGNGLN
jgi:hypothetical protein